MEAASCIKSVVMAATQYGNNPSDANTVSIQRQLDVLITVTNRGKPLKFFNARQLLPTECLTCVADILINTETKPVLIQKCLLLLSNLAQCSEICEMLHSVFDFTPTLASVIRISGGSSTDPVVQECVNVLQKITYNHKVPFQESYVEDLVNFLIKQIKSPETVLTQPSLGLLANLCRNNFSVQSYVKNLENIKALYRCLVSHLSHQNLNIIICSLSILTSLCLHDELGEKLFTGKNINQTFQSIFNILMKGDSETARRYAVDLFMDIAKNSKIQQSLLNYDHLPVCLEQVFNLICSSTPDSVVKLFELLISFCGVSELRPLVCKTLMCTAALQDPVQYMYLRQQPLGHVTEPFFTIVHWAGQSVDTHDNATLLALDFLKEIYEELVFSNGNSQISSHVDLVLPMATETLMAPLDGETSTLRKKCQKIVKATELLLALCGDEDLRVEVARCVDTKTLVKVLDYQFNNNILAINATRTNLDDPDDWSEAGVDVALYVLELMSKVKKIVVGMETHFIQALQDSRIVAFLAHGMTSENRDRVQISLQLIGLASTLEAFHSIMLGDCIAASNTRRANQPLRSDSRGRRLTTHPASHQTYLEGKENTPLRAVSHQHISVSRLSEEQDASIQILIEKMQTGMDVKDMKSSEILHIYESKIQALQTKEVHLQDLLDAKAMALAQADRLIGQYRSRRAQSEAESAKMCSLVKEAERRGEELREQLSETQVEKEKLQLDHDFIVQEHQRLVVIEEDYKELTSSFSEQSQMLENTQRSLAALKQQHQSVTEMHEMLRRHNETLKQQHNTATQQLVELEEDRKNIHRQHKEKEIKCNELGKSLQKLEEKYKKTLKERDELENAIDNLRSELSKAEQKRKELHHQVTSLELVCQQHEASIQGKDELIHNQKTELDQHAQIAALIHNLSSGKTDK